MQVLSIRQLAGATVLCLSSLCPLVAHAIAYRVTLLNSNGEKGSILRDVSGSSQVGQLGNHAMLWHGSAASQIDLNPPTIRFSEATGVDDDWQVGWGEGGLTSSFPEQTHALLWHGSAASVLDLNPPGFTISGASAVFGSKQVGYGAGPSTGGKNHALIWSGAANSAIDLHPEGKNFLFPDGYETSYVHDISGSHQVGIASYSDTYSFYHPMLWSGTAASAIDLLPEGYNKASANAISGNTQVGWAYGPVSNYLDHAMLWHGTAESAVDLNPPNLDIGYAMDVSAAGIVGYGAGVNFGEHALYWSGTAESMVDLHSYLSSAGTFNYSRAYGISDEGVIVGQALTFSEFYTVVWTPLPDFSDNGRVDAADYVKWRNGVGSAYTQSQYADWRAHFGESASSGAWVGAPGVPEPATLTITLAPLGWTAAARRRRRFGELATC